MDKYINNCPPECDGAKVYTMCPFHGEKIPTQADTTQNWDLARKLRDDVLFENKFTQAGWRVDNDFVANLYGLLRGMDTPRKTEVLNFIEHTVKKVEATARAEGAKEERERILKIVEGMFRGHVAGEDKEWAAHYLGYDEALTHLSEEIKKGRC